MSISPPGTDKAPPAVVGAGPAARRADIRADKFDWERFRAASSWEQGVRVRLDGLKVLERLEAVAHRPRLYRAYVERSPFHRAGSGWCIFLYRETPGWRFLPSFWGVTDLPVRARRST